MNDPTTTADSTVVNDVTPSRARTVRLSWSAALVAVVVVSGALIPQSSGLTGGEVARGGAIAALGAWGLLAVLVANRRLPTPITIALIQLAWYSVNVVIAASAGVTPLSWLRLAFPALVFPCFFGLAWAYLRDDARRVGGLLTLLVAAAALILINMAGLRHLSITRVGDLQMLRHFAGDYSAPFVTVVALPFVLTDDGRKVLPWPLGVLLLLIGMAALGLSFTRTYWIATACSTAVLVVLMARYAPRDFRRVLIAAPILLVVIILLLQRLPVNLLGFLTARASGLGQIGHVTSFEERLRESHAVLTTVAKEPLTALVGAGFGATFVYEWVNPVSGVVEGLVATSYVHNYYVYLLFVSGIVGLGLFVAVWGSWGRAMLRTRPRDVGTLALRLAAITAVVNLLVCSVATPQWMNYDWTAAFGLLAGAALSD